jgi:RNA polymerase sigma-70 factor (ECF subfamily)
MTVDPDGRGADVDAEASFLDHRRLLFAVAYRILGTASDAEDVVQDSWLKWSTAERGAVADVKAYLVRIATNLAVDRLRSARAQRETYVGPWLPEPVLTDPDVAEHSILADSVSMAMLVVLETLTPLERAVFVLREVFGFGYTEIADAVDRSEASVRQLGHRAREHVQARRPRFRPGPGERRAATEKFLAAALGGDLNELLEVLAPDVTLWTDGGGRVRAALHPIHGAAKVAAWLIGVRGRGYQGIRPEDMHVELIEVNAGTGILLSGPDRPLALITVEVDEVGTVTGIRAVANPDKLRFIEPGSGRID